MGADAQLLPGIWIGTAVAAGAFLATTAWIASRLRTGAGSDASAANRRVASGYYKPMSRLLVDDLVLLTPATYFTTGQMEQLRASRRRAFRGYLKDLELDFRSLHAEAREMLRDSELPQPNLAVELIKVYASFRLSLAIARIRLAAHALGIELPAPASVTGPVEWMHQQVELLQSPEFPAI